MLPALILLQAILASAASIPSAVVVIVPPNSTVVSEEVSFGASFAPDTNPDAGTTYGYASSIYFHTLIPISLSLTCFLNSAANPDPLSL